MSATNSIATPAVVRSTSLDVSERRSFLADVVIEHGPRDVLGRLFLKVDTALREKGIFASLGDCDELKAVNRANSDTWSPILPLFDPAISNVGRHNCNVVFGRNANGKVVVVHAARIYELGSTPLKDEIESLRLFYRNPAESAWPGEQLICTAPIAARTSGTVVFSGALWLHREMRGQNLTSWIINLWRGLVLTRWMPGLSFSFMVPELVKAGLAARTMMDVDWEVTMINTPVKRGGTINAGLTWITPATQIALMRDFLASGSAGRDTQVDGPVLERGRDKSNVG